MKQRARFTERLQAFAAYYVGPARGNGTRAAILAGVPPAGAKVWASRALTRPNVRALLEAHSARRDKAVIADADERDAVLTAILRDERRRPTDRIRAISELNKATGRHSMTHHLKGRATLEQLVAGSRRLSSEQP